MKVKCEYCGNLIDDTLANCPQCGAPNAAMSRAASVTPKTIEELMAWYAARKLPPYETTRFFIGKDYSGPRAFGIYEKDGIFTVYKNKADGTRAVRYRGSDEAYAVNEIYLKLKSEILNQKAHQGNSRGSSGNRQRGNMEGNNFLSFLKAGLVMFLGYGALRTKPLTAILLILVPMLILLAIHLFADRTKNGKLKNITTLIVRRYFLIYLIVAMLILCIVGFRAYKPHYYHYDNDIYVSYNGNYYGYDSYAGDYYYVDDYTLPPQLLSHPADYEFDSSDIIWDSSLSFTESNYYNENLRSESSSWSSSDSDYDWDSSSDWDSGSTDWDSDW